MLKIRVCFTKGEEVKFISHLNLVKTFIHALRRSRLPIAYSEGFSPHQKVSFGHPLPLGMKSRSEFMDIVLERSIEVNKIKTCLNQALPAGLSILDVREIHPKSRSLMSVIVTADYEIKFKEGTVPLKISLKAGDSIRKWVESFCEANPEATATIPPEVERVGFFINKDGKLISPMEEEWLS